MVPGDVSVEPTDWEERRPVTSSYSGGQARGMWRNSRRRSRISSFLQLNVDCAIWMFVLVAATLLRYEFDATRVAWPNVVAFGLVAGALHAAVGLALGLYVGKYIYGSFDEVRALALVVVLEAAILTLVVLVVGPVIAVPRSVVLIAVPFALILMFGVRYLRRLTAERALRPSDSAAPALVVGAGTAGDIIVRKMLRDPMSPLRPVGFVDDDPGKSRLQLHGVSVLGTTDEVVAIARQIDAEVLVVAIARAESSLLRRLYDIGASAGLQVLVAPTVEQMMAGKSAVTDLRRVSIEELLGRRQVDTRLEDMAGYLTGKRVLVTGAGGSIGSELCEQIHRFGPKELVMLDRDESGLQQAQLGTYGNGLLDTPNMVLADIREADVMHEVFRRHRPDVVFHAAALKHLPLLEQYPDEGWKTNVLGTLNVVDAARAVGVKTFINISTDKAANPTSVLGHSKRVAEKITAWAAEQTGERYLSVRFGNVIGSRGSMLPTFRTLIEAGGPLTVTHPEVTRYFMTIPEACQLVIQAGGVGRPSEVLILDMGEPVKILEVARRMIAMSGKDVEIIFTGLRDGEKLHEELVGDHEDLERPFHPQISHTHAKPIAPEDLDRDGWFARLGGASESVGEAQA